MTENGFTELNDIQRLDELLSHSAEQPVILFKHSETCGISARAHREMTKAEKRVAVVTVQLMTDFYKRFLAAGSPSRSGALRDSQLAMISGKKYSAPFYWAPFVLVGEWK